MPVLDAKLLGQPRIMLDGAPVRLPYKRAEALLFYLLAKGQATRSEMIDMLWQEHDAATAQKNLRHAIYSVRRAFGCDPFSAERRDALAFSDTLTIRCDVRAFLAEDDLSAYGGELLEDFSLPRAELFEEWLRDERNRMQGRYLRLLLQTGQAAFAAGRLDEAERCAERYAALDPLDEQPAILLMQIYVRRKRFRAAVDAYHGLARTLSDELGIVPLKETTELYYRIVNEWNAATAEAESAAERTPPPFGKSAALERLQQLCVPDARRVPLVLVLGKEGVGKTFLIDEFLRGRKLTERIVCRCACHRSERETAFAPWDAVMLQLTEALDARGIALPEAYLRTASALFPCLGMGRTDELTQDVEVFSPESEFHTARESALLILLTAARHSPLLLIFEDVHWMDENSGRLLSRLLRRLGGADISLVCTSREPLSSGFSAALESARRDRLADVVLLHEFSREDTAGFLDACLPGRFDEADVEEIYRKTRGNALALTQLTGGAESVDLSRNAPSGLDDVISRRLDALSSEERQVLDAVAVFADLTPFDMLNSILSMEVLELSCVCEQLCRKGFLTEAMFGGHLCFTLAHSRIGTLLFARRSKTARRILHLRVAQYCEQQRDRALPALYSKLVYHFSEGGDRFKAFRYQVLSLRAHAGLCYDLLPTLEREAEALAIADDAMVEHFRRLDRELERLRAVDTRKDELAQLERSLLFSECQYAVHCGDYEFAKPLLPRLEKASAEAGDWQMLFHARLQTIFYAIQIYDLDQMARQLDWLEAMRETLEGGAEWGVFLRIRGLYLLMTGEYEQARAYFERSIAQFRSLRAEPRDQYELNIAGAYDYIAECYRLEGAYETAFSYYDQAIIYNKGSGHYPGAAVIYTDYATAAYQNGNEAEALELFRCAEEIYESFHEVCKLPIALSYLARYDAREGAFDAAYTRLKKAHAVCERIRSPLWTGIVLYNEWKIRALCEGRPNVPEALRALWPASAREHCARCLACLRQVEPRLELREMDLARQELS